MDLNLSQYSRIQSVSNLNDLGIMGNGTSQEYIRWEFSLVGLVIMVTTDTWIIFSNLIMLIVFIRSRKMRKNVYASLVLMLTVSDLLIGVFVLAANLTFNMGFLNRPSCSLIWHAFITGVATSLYHTFLICVNRLLAAFTKEQLNRTIFVKNFKKIVIGIWVFIQMYLLSTVLLQSHNEVQNNCTLETLFGDNVLITRGALVVLFVPVFLLTIILYLISLVKIYRYYRRNRVGLQIQVRTVSERCERNVQQIVNASSYTFASDKRYILKAIKTLGLVILALTVLTGPFVFSLVISALGHELSPDIMISVSALVAFNSFTNPFIYTLRFQEVRSELKTMYSGCRKVLKRMKNECTLCL